MNEEGRAQEDSLENLITRKNTSRRILKGLLSKSTEYSELKPNALNVWESGFNISFDRYDPGYI